MHRARSLDVRPREEAPRLPIILFMQNTSPIRRYVLLRHRGHNATSSRWTMERIAPAPRDTVRATVDALRAKPDPQG
jgi:hypothetical protein